MLYQVDVSSMALSANQNSTERASPNQRGFLKKHLTNTKMYREFKLLSSRNSFEINHGSRIYHSLWGKTLNLFKSIKDNTE